MSTAKWRAVVLAAGGGGGGGGGWKKVEGMRLGGEGGPLEGTGVHGHGPSLPLSAHNYWEGRGGDVPSPPPLPGCGMRMLKKKTCTLQGTRLQSNKVRRQSSSATLP